MAVLFVLAAIRKVYMVLFAISLQTRVSYSNNLLQLYDCIIYANTKFSQHFHIVCSKR